MSDWESMTLWEKVRDKDPSRPKKTLRSILFWTLPLHYMGTNRVARKQTRFRFGREDVGATLPYFFLEIRTTKYHGPTYQNKPLSNGIRFHWYSWMWGWK